MRGSALTLGLMASGVLVSAPVLGQGAKAGATPQPAASDVATRVQKLYVDGAFWADKGQYEKARALFEEAFKLDARPQIAANLGNAELEVGKPREAAEHFDYFFREDKTATPAERAAIEDLQKKALAKIGTLRVTVDVPGAEVFVDGRSVGKAPLASPIYVDPGNYTIEAKAPGHVPASRLTAVAAGAQLPIDFKLAAAGETGGPGPIGPPIVPPPTEQGWRKPLMYTSIGLGVLGLGVGIGFTVAAEGKNQEVDDEVLYWQVRTSTANPICPLGVENDPRCVKLNKLIDERDSLMRFGIVGYALAGVGAAGAIAIALTTPKSLKADENKAPTVMVVPTLSGLVAFGSF
ncbi:PEGA domain-containing protein [Polyangium spumosum]|uniref:PEGA domain-containing protein n=1 Tax=Polyangium spumosum TaxID=889282 RepID=A0A6N7PWE0_9BACT|nr:PEGA domain-containing protein [Polyangium spumosum]MRG96388.1 PEGA domain-containing protein [Polyangium spumosum]